MESASATPHDAGPALSFLPAGSDDVAALVALVNSAYRGESSRRGWTTEDHLVGGQRTDAAAIAALLAAPGHCILMARAGDTLCGCMLLEAKPERVCYLGMLTVRPGLQAGGLGRRLLTAGEAWARQHFAAEVVEMTVIEARTELIAWYERRGYRRSGEYRAFPYDDQRFGLPKRDDLRFVVLERRIVP